MFGGGDALRLAIERIRRQVSDAIAGGVNLVILSDRYATEDHAPIPSLLITAAVHHHLIREKTRTRVGLVIETGEVREVHHIALLLGYGAAAVNPYLVFDAMGDLVREGHVNLTLRKASKNYLKAAGKGVLKIMSKMGISTVASYTGAQVFEAIGLSQDLVDEYFTGTTTRLGGVGLDVLAAEVARAPRARVPGPADRARAPRARRPAASTSGAARGSTTSSTRTPCSACSTRRARSATTSSSSTRRWSTSGPAISPRCAACSSCARASARRSRSTRSSRSRRSSSGSRPAR